MDPLPVIPTPPGQRWRSFRYAYAPVLVFTSVLLTIGALWQKHVAPATLVMQVEPVQRAVISPQAGIVTNLFVQQYERVEAGQAIAEVISLDDQRLDSQLQLLRSQISLSQLELAALIDRDRLAFDFHGLRVEYLKQKVELAMAEAELEPAERDFEIAQRLRQENVIGDIEVDYFEKIAAPLKAQVEQTTALVTELEGRLAAAADLGEFVTSSQRNNTFSDSLASLEEQRRNLNALASEPVILRSPIAGVVSVVHHQPGDSVLPGAPVVTVSATEGSRLVGYLHPPLSIEPAPGMPVILRTRSKGRFEAQTQLAAVGAQFEVITNLVFMRPGAPYELGLPIAVVMPEAFKQMVRPGEVVEALLEAP